MYVGLFSNFASFSFVCIYLNAITSGFPWGSTVNNLPAMWETWVRSLGWQDPLEKRKATHSSILAWKILGSQESDTTEQLSLSPLVQFKLLFFLLLSCQVMSTLHDPMDCFLVALHLPEFAQVPVHWIGEAIQPSHPLLPSSPSAFYLSQYQGLFQWVSCSHQVAKELELQHQSFLRVFRIDFL